MAPGAGLMRDLIEMELAASREIIIGGDDLVPRFRMQQEDGSAMLFVELSDDLLERQRRLDVVRSYMYVKRVRSFVMSTQVVEPDAVVAMGVSRDGSATVWQPISRAPLAFGEMTWLEPENVSVEIPALLPRQFEPATSEQVKAVELLIDYNDGLRLERLR